MGKITDAVKTALAPADPVGPARAARDKAAAALAGAEQALAGLEAAKADLSLDGDAIEKHVVAEQVAKTRIEVARRQLETADQALAAAEVEADANRKRALFDHALATRDAAVARVRKEYPTVVQVLDRLLAEIREADALVDEANRARVPDRAVLAQVSEVVFDRPYVMEREIGAETVTRWVYENGLPVANVANIRDNGDGTFSDYTSWEAGSRTMGSGGGRPVVRAAFRVTRFIPATPGQMGPRIPLAEPIPEWPAPNKREETRETRVTEPLPGPRQARLTTVSGVSGLEHGAHVA